MRASLKCRPFCGGSKQSPAPLSHRPIRTQIRGLTSSSAGCSGRGGVDFSSSWGARSVRKRARENLRSFPRRKFVCVEQRGLTQFCSCPIIVSRNRLQGGRSSTSTSLKIAWFSLKTPLVVISEIMSASAAKVSKKELNSNHDGGDETSGKKERSAAIFSFYSLPKGVLFVIFSSLLAAARVWLVPVDSAGCSACDWPWVRLDVLGGTAAAGSGGHVWFLAVRELSAPQSTIWTQTKTVIWKNQILSAGAYLCYSRMEFSKKRVQLNSVEHAERKRPRAALLLLCFSLTLA